MGSISSVCKRRAAKTKTEPFNDVVPTPAGSKCDTRTALGYLTVANSFIQGIYDRPREAVLTLISKCAAETEGTVLFYSAPNGRGRAGIVVLDQDVTKQSSFLVVFSSNPNIESNQVASEAHQKALAQAAANEVAIVGSCAAACVRTCDILEGLLLWERPLRVGSISSPDEMILGVRLWASLLAERMEKLQWRQSAEEAEQSLSVVLGTMDNIVNHEFSGKTVKAARDMIPPQVLQGRVKSDRVALWFYDEPARELVLNNSGSVDGIRVPQDKSILGQCVGGGAGDIVCLNDTEQDSRFDKQLDAKTSFNTKSVICVPIVRPRTIHIKQEKDMASIPSATVAPIDQREISGESRGTVPAAVVQFRNARFEGGSKGVNPQDFFTHFDLVGAEALQRSVLPTVLWLRDCFLRMLDADQQRMDLQEVVGKLSGTHTVKGVVRLVEYEVAQAMKCEACTLFFIDESRNEAWAPPTDKLPKGIRITLGKGLVGTVAKAAMDDTNADDQHAYVVNDPSACDLWAGDVCSDFTTRNIMTAPVRSPACLHRILGMIQVLNKDDWDDKEVSALSPRTTTSMMPRMSALQGDGGESLKAHFTPADVKLLDVLCQAVGVHLQRLMLEIMWSKSHFDDETDDMDTPCLVQEYYADDRLTVGGEGPPQSSRTIIKLDNAKQFKAASEEKQGDLMEKELLEDMIATMKPQVFVCHWSIDYWCMSEMEEFSILLEALNYHELLQELPIIKHVIYNFFSEMKKGYRDTPYHNFHHALSTIHYSFLLARAADIYKYLSKTDIFAMLMGALCHDCDHRGRNNAFEVMTRSELALRYNDSSPLENHSCARAFELALGTSQEHNCNIFQGFSLEDYTNVRLRMVAGILSTDMKYHGYHVEVIQTFDPQSGAHSSQSQFLVELFLHLADIANPLMPPDISARWSKALAEEFTAQTAEEKMLGMPVTAFMDNLTEPVAIAKSNLGFINFVINPLVDPMFHTFSGLASEPKTFLEQNKDVHAKTVEAANKVE